MAEAIVSTTVEMLRDLLVQEASFLCGVSNQVQDLQEELERMQCFLKDADKRQYEDESVRNWVKSIRNLAYKTEDVIETYAIKVESRRGRGIKKALKRLACIFDEWINLHKLGLEIGKIKSKMANLRTSLETYGIKLENQEQSSNVASRSLLRQTFAHEIEEHFVGMQGDMDRLVSLLTDGDKAHRIISIYGMGGLGKTTLAKQVFNHRDVQNHFQFFAWVAVSLQFDANRLLQEILRQLDPRRSSDDIKKMEYTQLVQELCEVQRVKKCLVVLDDIWKIEDWTVLRPAFLATAIDCKVLLTTRKLGVAEIGIPYKLNLFSEEEGWDLLKKKALAGTNATEQENIGKEMVRKCGYLPLAISMIGGILSKKKTLEEWETVNRDVDSYLRSGGGTLEDNHQVSQILTLSYEDLPYQLKPCFLYFAYYPEDTEIEVERLYRMWIAEGMVLSKDQRRKETLVEVAKRYLLELASRSLVQVQLDESSMNNSHISCRLHDLIRDLCLRKCEEEDFFEVMDFRGSDHINLVRGNAYRLSIYGGYDDIAGDKIIQGANESTRLLSVWFLYGGWRLNIYGVLDNFGKLQFLKVVVFCNVDLSNTKLLHKAIGKLIHIRFLCFYYCNLKKIPSSIAKLTYLQTFEFLILLEAKVPNVFWKLKRLMHLVLVGDIYVGERQLRLDCLEELETLVCDDACSIEVKDLPKLTNLRIFGLNIKDNESLLTIINCVEVHWRNIQEIRLVVIGDCDLHSTTEGSIVLSKLFMCRALHELCIHVRIRELPRHDSSGMLASLSNLVSLVLENCFLGEDPMITLEKLPKLGKLWLYSESFVGEEMTCTSTGFPSLTKLELSGLLNLKKWRIDEGAMPKLSNVEIWRCSKLEMIPDGMKFLKALRQLVIHEMPKEFNDRVRVVDGREGADFHKVRHVPLISIDFERI